VGVPLLFLEKRELGVQEKNYNRKEN
jgi:hypothetical protein